MKFGVMNLFPAEHGDGAAILRETLEEIQFADELGFDSCWLAEHHFSRYGVLGNPLLVAASIAQRTNRIRIGTAVCVVPFHHPLRLAEDAATLDVLTEGRLVLGLGTGYQPREFNGFGRDPAQKRLYYNETVEILRKAWNEEGWSYEGKLYQFEDMDIFPKPFTAGGPPIVHATTSPEAFEYNGVHGNQIIVSSNFTPMGRLKQNYGRYREALVENGHDVTKFWQPFMQQVWCGSNPARRSDVAEAALRYYQSVGQVIPGSDEALAADREYYEKVKRNINLLTVENLLTHGGNFGSVDQVVDLISRLRDELPRYFEPFYKVVTLGYSEDEDPIVERMVWWLALAIIILAPLLLHGGVIPWLFQLMPSMPGWYDSVQGPQFLTIALSSAISGVIIMTYLFRARYDWHHLLTDHVLRGLTQWLGFFVLLFLWLQLQQVITGTFHPPVGVDAVTSAMLGHPVYWFAIGAAVLILAYIFASTIRPSLWTPLRAVAISVGILSATLLEKVLFLVEGLQYPGFGLYYAVPGVYFPSFVEMGAFIGTVSMIVLFFLVVSKMFPVIELHAVEDHHHEGGD